MKAIMIMYDSLNRRFLPPYGCDWVHAPNFQRLAEKSVTFKNSYVGSMACMPARRELHTGRYNFLHRSWGPLEPFDESMPELLKENGIYTHLVSDHGHYWEDGGCTYHTRYNTWEISRGQEGDPWKGQVKDPEIPKHLGQYWAQDAINRKYMDKEEKQPQAKTFAKGLEFIETNKKEDDWFLQIETFDPHEPFFTQEKYKELYSDDYDGPHFDWPPYDRVKEEKDQVEHVRKQYAALVSMCDNYLGKVLDLMDENNLWEDTMLIVNTDHGFLLGEHDWWAKCAQPLYNEVARTPLFIWNPKVGEKHKECNSLVQTVDLAPTLLDYFGVKIPETMEGASLKETIQSDKSVRDAALFGLHGGHVNCTDGRYVYMRAPVNKENSPLYNYTLMPTHMRARFSVEELQTIELSKPFSFTKNCKLMKLDAHSGKNYRNYYRFGTLLFDLKKDPRQKNPINDSEIEEKMIFYMIKLMKQNDTPLEQFQRLGLEKWLK